MHYVFHDSQASHMTLRHPTWTPGISHAPQACYGTLRHLTCPSGISQGTQASHIILRPHLAWMAHKLLVAKSVPQGDVEGGRPACCARHAAGGCQGISGAGQKLELAGWGVYGARQNRQICRCQHQRTALHSRAHCWVWFPLNPGPWRACWTAWAIIDTGCMDRWDQQHACGQHFC